MNAIGRLFASLYNGNVGTSIKRLSVNKSVMKSDLPSKGCVWHWWEQNSDLGYEWDFLSDCKEVAYSLCALNHHLRNGKTVLL